MQIRIDVNKKGKKVAFHWDRRWFRMSMDTAELILASGRSDLHHVYYGPNPYGPGHFEFVEIDDMTTKIVKVGE